MKISDLSWTVALLATMPALWAGAAELGDGFSGPAEWVTLVVYPPVADELEMTDLQRQGAKRISESFRESLRAHYREVPGGSLEERVKRDVLDAASRSRANQQIAASLEPGQLTRLKQISWQVLGAESLFDPEVSKAVQLTSDQQERLAAARKQNEAERREMSEKMQQIRLTPEGLRQFKAKYAKSAEGRLTAVLTAAQRDTFQQLLGEPSRALKAADGRHHSPEPPRGKP